MRAVEVSSSIVLDCTDFLIDSARPQQIVVSVKSSHFAIVQNQDAVTIFNAADALGNDDFGHVWQIFAQCRANAGIGRVVTSAGAVVKHHDLGSFQQSPGDAQALFLTARDIGASLFDTCVVAIGHLVDELVGTCYTAGLPALFQRGILVSPAQILQDRSGKEYILLKYDRHLVAQGFQVVILYIFAANQYGPLTGVI